MVNTSAVPKRTLPQSRKRLEYGRSCPGHLIRDVYVHLGMTRAQFAALIERSPETVRTWERVGTAREMAFALYGLLARRGCLHDFPTTIFTGLI